MIALVSDTSVLIDLERGDLLEVVFQSDLALVVPDVLYERELKDFNGPLLRRLGLGVVSLAPDEVAYAQQIKSARAALSLVDCFALACARREGHALITGDKKLRSEALSQNCTVFGLLWLLDQMEASGKVAHSTLHEGLMRIAQHPYARLPGAEVRARLEKWGAANEG